MPRCSARWMMDGARCKSRSQPRNRQRSPFHRTADGTIWGFLAEALILPTGLISAAYLTRAFGPDGYGLFSLAAALTSFAGGIATSLFARGSIKLVSEANDWQPVATTIVRMHFACGVATTLIVIVFARPIAVLLEEPRLAFYLYLFSLEPLLFVLARAHRSVLIGIGRFREQAVPIALRSVTRLLLMIVLVESGLSISGAVLAIAGASLIELVIYRGYIRLQFIPASTYPASRLWSQSTPIFFSAICLALFSRIDLFAITSLGLPTLEAGYYGAAQNLSIIPGLFTVSFTPLLLSTLSTMLKNGEHENARIMSRDAMRLVFGMLPFVAVASGAAHEIVTLIFGARFAPAEPILAWLLFGKVAAVMISIATVIMIIANRPGLSFALAAPMLALATAGHVLLIPIFGSLAAAWVTTSLEIAGALAALIIVYRVQCASAPMATVTRTLVIGGAAWLAGALVPAPGFWVIAKLALVALAIVAGYGLLGEFSAREIAWGRAMLRLPERP
ncbi:MAG: oligosaccharide flippase family protein [Gammaproteobacteria bacterium]